MTGTVYLLHFDVAISDGHPCQHYVGWTEDLTARVKMHRKGRGSVLCRVAKERGIDFTVVKTWDGDRSLERQIKNRKNGKRTCPVCTPRKIKNTDK